ncbi:uncharacterized protein LOC113766089 [Coffea eugenioides]|uniref:uncharacterized protein LOC113766089 n=1 Tax=Coffea eugenioides TaxID=49369 RepID=UPI000F610418|nr:uncharacterized protein LOC113766089 [Coffea eugenioides]
MSPTLLGNTIARGPTGGDSQNFQKRTYRQANLDQAEPSSNLFEVISYGPNVPVPVASNSHETLSLKLIKEQLIPVRTPLVGFEEHVVHPEGMVTLTVTVGHHPCCRTILVNFVMVKAGSPYNLIMGRPTLNVFRAVYSTYHLSFKFSIPAGIAEQIEKPKRVETRDKVEDIPLDLSNPDQTVRVDIHLPDSLRRQMVDLLKEHRDIFVWATDEIQGVPHHFMVYELNINPQARSVEQKKRHFGPERSKAVGEEVDKLLPAKMIREVQYLT